MKKLHIGVGRGTIEVEIVFLDVLAVVGLAVGQSVHPLLEDRVLAVPQRQGKAQPGRDHLTAAELRASRTQTFRVWAEISSVIAAA
jgi:hypothetical protein